MATRNRPTNAPHSKLIKLVTVVELTGLSPSTIYSTWRSASSRSPSRSARTRSGGIWTKSSTTSTRARAGARDVGDNRPAAARLPDSCITAPARRSGAQAPACAVSHSTHAGGSPAAPPVIWPRYELQSLTGQPRARTGSRVVRIVRVIVTLVLVVRAALAALDALLVIEMSTLRKHARQPRRSRRRPRRTVLRLRRRERDGLDVDRADTGFRAVATPPFG